MSKRINILEWDSEFFNFPIGQVQFKIESLSDLEEIVTFQSNHKKSLCYYSSSEEIPVSLLKHNKLSIQLADRKTTYIKSINPNLTIDQKVHSANVKSNEDQLNKLAILSGQYSRFNTDSNFTKSDFEKLYIAWMKNSLNKTFAKEVLVYDGEVGMVTLSEKDNRADIGLIAVENNSQGKGIGKSLMESAEKWFANHKYNTIQVITQGDNSPAKKLYESCGYSIEKTEYVYHIWKK